MSWLAGRASGRAAKVATGAGRNGAEWHGRLLTKRDVAGWSVVVRKRGSRSMVRNLVRGVLNLVLAAAATWLANYLVERLFGPEEATED